jgi:hypothetical protein
MQNATFDVLMLMTIKVAVFWYLRQYGLFDKRDEHVLGRGELHTVFWWGDLTEENLLQNQGVNRRTI